MSGESGKFQLIFENKTLECPQSARFVGQWQIAAQTTNVASHSPRDGAQFLEGRIALPSFNPANVTGGSIRLKREVFLRQPFGFARFSNPFTQKLQRGWFFQP
jgi:hypothetical protein